MHLTKAPALRRFSLAGWLLLAVACSLAAPGEVAGADWYVSPTGNDGAAGTLGAPFRTVTRGLAAGSPGSTVHVRAGTYAEALKVDPWQQSGFTLAAYAGETVTIAPPPGSVALTLSTVRGLTVRGLRFINGGVNLQMNATNVVFQDCAFESTTGDFTIRIDGTRNVEIARCTFTDNRAPVIVSVTGSNDDLRILDNTFTDNHSSGSQLQATILVTKQAPTQGIRIAGNTFRMTRDKSTRPVIPLGDSASAIMLHQCQGGNFSQPSLSVVSNVIQSYRFRGTNDDRWYDPTYLKTPEQGGEQGDGITAIETTHARIAGNQVLLAGAYGFIGHLVTNLAVLDNEFRQCGLNGVFLAGNATTKAGAAPNLIAGNRIFNCGWLKGGTSGISAIHPGVGNLILRNFVSGQSNGTPGTVGANWYGDGNGILADLDSRGAYLIGNVVVSNQGSGITLNRATDIVVAHNTIVGNGHCPHRDDNAGILISGEFGPADRAYIANNLLYNNRLSQLWVWKTALDHTVHHNVLAPGPLTRSDRRDYPVNWYVTFYTLSNWIANPPLPGNGVGELGERPVFLGDLVGGNPMADPLYYLPVNGSAGAADAAARASLPAWSPPAGLAGTPLFEEALSAGFSTVPRPASAANRGALEPPPGSFPAPGGGFVRLLPRSAASTEPWVWAEHLATWLELRDGRVFSADFGYLQPTTYAGWILSSYFGYAWHGLEGAANDGWISTERFGWMKFVAGGDGSRYLWVHHLQTWLVVQADGAFHSFDFGRLTPLAGSLTRYDSRIGPVTAAESNPPGWLVSDRFGYVWFARDGTGVWFWSTARNEWLGLTPGGGIWSTAEGRFL